jgi:hypothetical protein
VLAAAAVLVAALTACAPAAGPTPSPTPTWFASEKEAFAAAEETYRAYIDETNSALTAESEADPSRFLSGQALTDEQAAQDALADSNRKLVGALQIKSFQAESWTRDQVQAFVCVQLDGMRVQTLDGKDVTPASRSTTNLLELRLTGGQDLRIASSILRSENC